MHVCVLGDSDEDCEGPCHDHSSQEEESKVDPLRDDPTESYIYLNKLSRFGRQAVKSFCVRTSHSNVGPLEDISGKLKKSATFLLETMSQQLSFRQNNIHVCFAATPVTAAGLCA